jgi:hypothetical protein
MSIKEMANKVTGKTKGATTRKGHIIRAKGRRR